MDLNTVFLKYGHNGLWQTPSLKMARIVMLLKVVDWLVVLSVTLPSAVISCHRKCALEHNCRWTTIELPLNYLRRECRLIVGLHGLTWTTTDTASIWSHMIDALCACFYIPTGVLTRTNCIWLWLCLRKLYSYVPFSTEFGIHYTEPWTGGLYTARGTHHVLYTLYVNFQRRLAC